MSPWSLQQPVQVTSQASQRAVAAQPWSFCSSWCPSPSPIPVSAVHGATSLAPEVARAQGQRMELLFKYRGRFNTSPSSMSFRERLGLVLKVQGDAQFSLYWSIEATQSLCAHKPAELNQLQPCGTGLCPSAHVYALLHGVYALLLSKSRAQAASARPEPALVWLLASAAVTPRSSLVQLASLQMDFLSTETLQPSFADKQACPLPRDLLQHGAGSAEFPWFILLHVLTVRNK